MPNKTIYVSEADLPLFQRAQELGGGNLSSVIATSLRRYVEFLEGYEAGFKEVTVNVGIGKGQKQRFMGIQLARWGRSNDTRYEEYRVYRTPKGNFAVHIKRSANAVWTSEADTGTWKGTIRAYLGMGEQSGGETPGEAVLEVYPSLEALREHVPVELYGLVASLPDPGVVQDLDI